jgi:energy-coupling factor transport system permease protein
MVAMGFPIAFAVAPGDIGPTFARLGVPYKFAYAIDLTFRFVPSLASDMATTMDAQRVRGYDWDRVRGGPIGRLRMLGPLMVPVTINAIVGAEDTIDAMDLRGFGTERRTWLRQLAYRRVDFLVLGGFGLLLVAITILSLTGHTRLWVPDFLIQLAR